MWGGSSDLKPENRKVSESGGIYIRNQVTLYDDKSVWLRSHMWIQSMQCGLPHIYILYYHQKISKGNNRRKTDADIMSGNTPLPVNHKACVTHCHIMIQEVVLVKHR